MTKAMSNEWAVHGIQCNSIHPGIIAIIMHVDVD